MKVETHDILMELWEDLLHEQENYRTVIVDELTDMPFEEESKAKTLDKLIHYSGRIIGLEEACEKIRALTKHADIEEEPA